MGEQTLNDEDTVSTFDEHGNVIVLPRSEFVRQRLAEARKSKGNPGYLTRIGGELIAKGFPREAISIYEWASKTMPQAPEPRVGLGVCYFLIGKSRKAKRILTACLGEHPDNAAAHFQLARVYEDLRDHLKSAEHLDRAMEIDPNNHRIISAYLQRQKDLGLPDRAVKRISSLALDNEEVWGPTYVLGLHYLDSRQYDRAAEMLTTVIDRGVDDNEVLTEITGILGELDRSDLIVKHLEPIATERVLGFGPLWNLARAYYEINEYENAQYVAEGLLHATTDPDRATSLQRFLGRIGKHQVGR
jgi:tetratricopeptide (TPR) repeat protein